MPVRYTCRLIIVDTPSGKLRVKYGYLGEARFPSNGGRGKPVVAVHGPSVVVAPEEEMTEAELRLWVKGLRASGFSEISETVPLDAPLIVPKKTIEDEIEKGSVKWALRWLPMPDEGAQTTLVVEVTNKRGEIPNFSLKTNFKHHAPQSLEVAPSEFEAEVLGFSESVFSRASSPGGDSLPRNCPVLYAYDPEFLDGLRNRAAMMSSDNHWISLCTDEYEFDRIPGAAVAAFMETEPPLA